MAPNGRGGEAAQPGVGKRTLVEQTFGRPSAAQELASEAVASRGGELPYFEEIERSFGRHDSSGVSAHQGAAAHVVQRKTKDADADAERGPKTAAAYFADHQAKFFEAIRSRLASVALPPPHERLTWAGGDAGLAAAFEHAMIDANGTDMDLAHQLPALLYPTDPWQVIDLHRDLDSGRPGERIDRQPALGAGEWNPIAGKAIALEIEASLRRSLPRMGLRYVAQADQYAGEVGPDMLVASHPFDRVAARLVCDPAVVHVTRAHGRGRMAGGGDKRADTASPTAFKNGLRLVIFEWQGARDPKLWNWVRVTEPADATPEEVSAAVFERLDGRNHTEHAYALTAAPPFFRVPPDWARKVPGAAEHAPAREADEDAESRSALDLADSSAGDDAAGAQAGAPSAALDLPALQHALDRSEAQLRFASDRLVAWKLGHLIGPAIRWVERRKDKLLSTPDAALKRWAPVVAVQSRILVEALGDLIEVADSATAARATPGTSEARPFCEVIEAIGIAMGESHLAATATAQLATAKRLKAALPLTLLDRTTRATHDAAQELSAGGPVPASRTDSTDLAAVARGTSRTLEASGLALREKLIAGGSLDPAELDAVAVSASEETLRTRILTLYRKLDLLDEAAEQATDGATGHLGNLFNTDVRNLHRELVEIKPLAWNILETMRREALPQQPTPTDPAQVQAAFARARKQAVANAQAAFAKLAEDHQLGKLFPRALDSISQAQRNTAYFTLAVQIAALIGVSVVGSVAGALVSGVVRGALLAEAAADTAAFARTATAARWAGAAANVVTDAAVQSAAQTAMFGGDTKLTFIENVMTNLMTLGALRPFHALGSEIGQLDHNARGLWKVASAGKVVVAGTAKLTMEMLVSAGASYVAAQLVEGKPPPSDDVAASWAMQGAAMAVGKFVHLKMQELTARWGRRAEQKVQLIRRARAQEALARQIEQAGGTEAALRLLEQHVRLLEDERALLENPAAVAQLGVDDAQLGVLHAGNDAALADARSQSFEIMRLRFHGLEPVAANGLIWSGTRAQIEAALGEVDATATQTSTTGSARWTAHIAGRDITFLECGPPAEHHAHAQHDPSPAGATSGDQHVTGTSGAAQQGAEAPTTKPRVTEPVKGLFEAIKTDTKIADWTVVDDLTIEPDGTKVAATRVTTPDGKTGFVERSYNTTTKQLEMRNAFLDRLPGWVNEGGPGLAERGVPTVHYLTLRQMKLLGVGYAGYKRVKMSTIQNVRGVIEFNALLAANVDPNTAILKTRSVEYGETTIQQSGERVVGAEVKGGDRSPLQMMLDWYERGFTNWKPRDPALVAIHDELISKYGRGVITRDTIVLWNYDIYLNVEPFASSAPPITSP